MATSPRWKTIFSGLVPSLVALVLFGYRLGTPGLWTDESIYAQTAREMLAAGDWITPHLCGEPYLIKPVLYHWLAMLGFWVVGETELGARLPQTLAGLLGVGALGFFAARFLRPRIGFRAGLILATSLGYVVGSRVAGMDLLLTSSVSLCLLTFYGGYLERERRWIWFLVSGVAAGIALLAKGALGFGLPGLIVLLFLWRRGDLRVLGSPAALGGTGAALGVAALWLGPAWYQNGEEFTRVFWLQNQLARLATPVSEHAGPIFYYVPVLLVGLLPWSFPFISAGARAGIRFWRNPSTRRDPLVELLWLWFLVPVVFFSLISTKLAGYILPVLPAVALLTAREWERQSGRMFSENKGFRLTAAGGILCLPGLALALPWLVGHRYEVDPETGWLYFFLVAAPAAAAFGSALWGRLRGSWWILASACFCLGFVPFVLLPAAPFESMKELTGQLLERREAGNTVALAGRHLKGTYFYTKCSLRMIPEMNDLPPPGLDRPAWYLVKDRFRPNLEAWAEKRGLRIREVEHREELALVEVSVSPVAGGPGETSSPGNPPGQDLVVTQQDGRKTRNGLPEE